MIRASVTPIVERYYGGMVRRNNNALHKAAERQDKVVVSRSIDCRT